MTILRARLFTGFTALALAIVAPPAQAGNSYVFTNFDGPPDFSMGTTVDGINNLGQVVGFSTGATGANTNFIRNADGSLTPLTFNGSSDAQANGINNSGQVVGFLGSTGQAFFLTNGNNTLLTLPAVNGSTDAEAAYGINDKGAIVGAYLESSTITQLGFVYANGSFTTLNPVANDTEVFAQGINNNGLVVGYYTTNSVNDHGFLYNTTNGTYTLIADPNVGSNLVLTQFLGINDNNEAVGYYQTTNGSQYGFLYNIATETYTFLNDPNAATSGMSITQITGINDSGEITGFYVDANSGLQRGFVATTSVPEPGSMALLGVGVTLVAGYARRRARNGRSRS